ncbi:Arm DNA-binding domain-containing protein [Desulfuromonas acetoxidans]|uniref:Integrase DNA-binding domain-containing protein n=1 Tax=Desulfuromonas acetoxidans (strain DSM 684 / 11070) TaxID=281689 RepID=Q1JWN4_DESA6|nr:Arm DNA-binding domain-containing protein [Desulfuromonas acetoxidans]EAT14645.1 hypothetical protein Dace_0608 [Desulfuromonas acetoxidans DSM 684]
MNLITDIELQHVPEKDTWLCDADFNTGHGVLCAKVSTTGERKFYFRYYTENFKRVRLALGKYDPAGRRGLTLYSARKKARELSSLHKAGIKNIREHLSS